MYALIENGAVTRYPYSERDLKKANPHVSFPALITDAVLTSFGVQRVFNSTPPTVTSEQVLEEDSPVFDVQANRWAQVFSVRSKTADELNAETQAQADVVRAERNEKLAATDWRFRSDMTPSQAWVDYCQALRDIPNQTGFPQSVQWPVAP